MFSMKSHFKNVALFQRVLLIALLVNMSALTLSHDITHAEHEQNEVCNILCAFGSNNDAITPQPVQYYFQDTQKYFVDLVYRSFDTNSAFYQKSRAPPLLASIVLI